MSETKFKGNPVKLYGEFVKVGDNAPSVSLVKADLSTLSLEDLKGKKAIFNIFPSLDTGVCAASVRRFNKEASELKDTVVVCVSKDLPFAMSRFCVAEGLNDVIPASDFRGGFDKAYGVLMEDGPLSGLLARSIVIVDEEGKVIYTEMVKEIVEEPDYAKALEAVK